MGRVYQNNYSDTLAVAAGVSDLVLEVNEAPDALGAGNHMILTLTDSLQTPTKIEIVKCTGISGTNLTVEREQEGTVAETWAQGAFVECRITKTTFDIFFQTSGSSGTVKSLGSEPFEATPVSNAIEYSHTDGDSQYSQLTQSNTTLSIANDIPAGSGITIILIDADTYPPNVNLFVPLADNREITFGKYTRIFVDRFANDGVGVYHYSYGGSWSS